MLVEKCDEVTYGRGNTASIASKWLNYLVAVVSQIYTQLACKSLL